MKGWGPVKPPEVLTNAFVLNTFLSCFDKGILLIDMQTYTGTVKIMFILVKINARGSLVLHRLIQEQFKVFENLHL